MDDIPYLRSTKNAHSLISVGVKGDIHKIIFTQTKTGRGILLFHSRSNTTIKNFCKASHEFFYLRTNMETCLFDNDNATFAPIQVYLKFLIKFVSQ